MDDKGKAVLRPRNPGESIKVAETVLKRRDRNLKAAADRAAQIARIKVQKKEYKKGKLNIIRAERLVKNSRNRQGDRRRLLNVEKKPLPKINKGRILAAVRNGRMGGSKEAKATLRNLGLKNRHSLVFLPNDKGSSKTLRRVKPFAFWGPVSFKVVENLIHKRAAFRDPSQPDVRTALSDNVLIEKHLGDLGVLCTEDLAHAIATKSKLFEQVNARLWPIPLGDAKKAGKLVHDRNFTFGDLREGMADKIEELLGE